MYPTCVSSKLCEFIFKDVSITVAQIKKIKKTKSTYFLILQMGMGLTKVERGLKEDERVARGHFHDRVGESPARCSHFGTTRSSLARLLSEISQFENCESVDSNL